ncbi:MAG: septal ring lytic transglycosylase RlpA family protein [Ginsengibacter sp.]
MSQKIQPAKKHRYKVSKADAPVMKYGIASFYADKLQGHRTFSGEIYQGEKCTAACNGLPMNTLVKVTNLRNNKSVTVKINDKMKSKNKRLIDLSKSAAQQLAFISRGITNVQIEVLDKSFVNE